MPISLRLSKLHKAALGAYWSHQMVEYVATHRTLMNGLKKWRMIIGAIDQLPDSRQGEYYSMWLWRTDEHVLRDNQQM